MISLVGWLIVWLTGCLVGRRNSAVLVCREIERLSESVGVKQSSSDTYGNYIRDPDI